MPDPTPAPTRRWSMVGAIGALLLVGMAPIVPTAASGGAAVGGAADPAAEAAGVLELSPLAQAVTRTPVPVAVDEDEDDPCRSSVDIDGEETCQNPAEGTSSEHGALQELVTMETARGWARLAPLQGAADGAMVRVHSFGEIAALDGDGETLWRRTSTSHYADWDTPVMTVPRLLMGASPLVPQIRTSERTFAVADLTGDGVDDVAFGATVRVARTEGGMADVAMVTVLDGRDGATLWHQRMPGHVTQVLAVGDLLLVGNESGETARISTDHPWEGEEGTTTTLRALQVAPTAGGLDVSEAWTHDTGQEWARLLALEPAGEGRTALAWTDAPRGSAAGTVVLLAPDGEALFQTATDGYPRALRHDPTRDRMVVHVQHDPGSAARDVGYTLLGLDLQGGDTTTLVTRGDAVLLGLVVQDTTGDDAPELVTSDLQWVAPTGPQLARDRVIVADGESGSSIWEEVNLGHSASDRTWRAPGNYRFTYGLAVADGTVLAAAYEPFDQTSVRAFDAATGTQTWERIGGHEPVPLFLDPVEQGVAATTDGLLLRVLDPADGAAALAVPIPADAHDTVMGDITGDGHDDLLVAMSSGVFAFDGAALPGELRELWRTPTQGTPRTLQLADLSGDGELEIAVAATAGVDVLRADGSIRDSIPIRPDLPDPFVWTLTIADVDADGDLDLVVPTTTVAALDGPTGEVVWEFTPRDDNPRYFSEAAVAADGTVVLSMVPYNPRGTLAPRHTHSVIGLEGATGELDWLAAAPHPWSVSLLWDAVELWTDDDGSERVATLWNGRPADNNSPIATNIGRVDTYDPSSGELLSRAETRELGSAHVGMGRLDGDLVMWGLHGLAIEIEGAEATETATTPALDATIADLGAAGPRYVNSMVTLRLHQEGDQRGDNGAVVDPAAIWNRFYAGDVTAADLDADGSDELVVGFFDYEAFFTVALYYGTQGGAFDLLPHGLAVLDATGGD